MQTVAWSTSPSYVCICASYRNNFFRPTLANPRRRLTFSSLKKQCKGVENFFLLVKLPREIESRVGVDELLAGCQGSSQLQTMGRELGEAVDGFVDERISGNSNETVSRTDTVQSINVKM